MPIPAPSTTLVLPSLRKAWTSVCCGTSSDLIASVWGSCSSVQAPQSGLLHCMPHGKPACHLLSFGTLPPHLGTFTRWNGHRFDLYSPFKAHTAVLQKWRCSASHDSEVVNQNLVLRMKFIGVNRHLCKAAKRYASP